MLTTTLDPRAAKAQVTLSESPFNALRRINVEQQDDQVLVLSGFVSTFYQKQQAQEAVRGIVDGLTVVNDIEVID